MSKYDTKHIALNSTQKLVDGEYYKYTIDKGFKLVDVKDIIYKTYTVDSLYSYYKSYTALKNDIEKLHSSLSIFIKDYFDIKYDGDLEYTIVKVIDLLNKLTLDVEGLYVIKTHEDYVQSHNEITGVITYLKEKIPLDIDNGCYTVKLVNGELEFELDKIKYERELFGLWQNLLMNNGIWFY